MVKACTRRPLHSDISRLEFITNQSYHHRTDFTTATMSTLQKNMKLPFSGLAVITT